MNMNKALAVWTLAGAAVIAGVASEPVVAQNVAGPRVVEGTPKPDKYNDKLIDIRFAGGTVEQYVDAVSKATAPLALNVIWLDDAGSRKRRAVDLTRVSVNTAIQFIQHLNALESDEGASGSFVPSDNPDAFPILMVSPKSNRGNVAEMPMILSIAEFIDPAGAKDGEGDRLPVRTVLKAIEIAVEMATGRAEAPAQIQFHPETGILAISGSNSQRQTAKEVTESLRRDFRMQTLGELAGKVGRHDMFKLTFIQATEAAQAIRVVFPVRPTDPKDQPMDVTADEHANSIMFNGTQAQRAGAKALIAFLDRAEPVPAVRAALEQARQIEMRSNNAMMQSEMARRQLEDQTQAFRKRLDETERELTAARQLAEVTLARSSEFASQLERARKIADENAAKLAAVTDERESLSRAVRDLQEQIAKLKK